MRTFIVYEPRSCEELSAEALRFVGAEVLASSAKQAAATYVEQRPQKWGRYLDLWVVDKLEQPRGGPATYQVRFNGNGEPSFFG